MPTATQRQASRAPRKSSHLEDITNRSCNMYVTKFKVQALILNFFNNWLQIMSLKLCRLYSNWVVHITGEVCNFRALCCLGGELQWQINNAIIIMNFCIYLYIGRTVKQCNVGHEWFVMSHLIIVYFVCSMAVNTSGCGFGGHDLHVI